MDLIKWEDFSKVNDIQLKDVILLLDLGFFKLSFPCEIEGVFRSGFRIYLKNKDYCKTEDFFHLLKESVKIYIQFDILGENSESFCSACFLKEDNGINSFFDIEICESSLFNKQVFGF